MTSAVLTIRHGAVQVLVMNNPAARNAITAGLHASLPAALAEAQSDPRIGAIVLTGADGFFCSGGDLRVLGERRDMAPAQRRERLEGLHDLIRAIRDCGKPVIAAVEGGAAGAGVSIALACDMLVAARNAFFSVAYVKVGLTPDGGVTAFLSEFLSRQLLTELCLTGDRITAERMAALGAVNRLSDAGSAQSDAIALAARIADGPSRAIARIKTLCRYAHRAALDAQLELEAGHMVDALGDDEATEGIGAFFAKRAPQYAALRRGSDPTT
jgi:enoyl-CoA hydratase/carnithine racemase